MNIVIFGGAGFIGTNLTFALGKQNHNIKVIDLKEEYFKPIQSFYLPNVKTIAVDAYNSEIFETYIDNNTDIVYHLISFNNPTTSNQHILNDLDNNINITINMLDVCKKYHLKLIFLSSGGTVYGPYHNAPLTEESLTNPISSYGIQKLTIEKLIQLYNYLYNMDYNIIRLSNPYGPYQRPNGQLGVVSAFTYNILNNKPINIYGDGSVVRDFIYIDDAINGIINITNYNGNIKIFNLGIGIGTDINTVIKIIEQESGQTSVKNYLSNRRADVKQNILNIKKYCDTFGVKPMINLRQGIKKTILYLRSI